MSVGEIARRECSTAADKPISPLLVAIVTAAAYCENESENELSPGLVEIVIRRAWLLLTIVSGNGVS